MPPFCIPAIAFCLIATAGPGANFCAEHDVLAGLLRQTWNEEPIGIGINSRGVLVELYTSSDGGNWTLVYTTPDGRSCVITAGQNWQRLAPQLPEAKL